MRTTGDRGGARPDAAVWTSVAALVAGIAAGLWAVPAQGWVEGSLTGRLATAAVSLSRTWTVVSPMDATATARYAGREDTSCPVRDTVLLVASVVSLLTVATMLVGKRSGGPAPASLALGLVAVVLSWGMVHTIFTLRYAGLYYRTSTPGGIDVNQDEPPRYRDVADIALARGMTFQVSDAAIRDSEIRATALRHALLAYLFGTLVIAVTVNMLAGPGA
ncbi:MAG TPA: DUF1345 domain-containing protein [Cellulomonadaceae bacterium]|nr:DUF1345 domain-containing protein [Cellulomonadaceae bacterium]